MNKLNVVTVCFNDCASLQLTIESVLNQVDSTFNYFIIDGGSSDGTIGLLEYYKKELNNPNISFKYISEPDHGIYDAMNKTIKLVSEGYVLFLNAGDTFYSNQTLSSIQKISPTNFDILYGSTHMIGDGFDYIQHPLSLERIINKMVFCHQSVFVSIKLLEEHKFDTSFRICADYESFLYFYFNKKRFLETPLVISNFKFGGASKVNRRILLYDNFSIHKKYGIHDSLIFFKISLMKESIKSIFRKMLPTILLRIKNNLLNKLK